MNRTDWQDDPEIQLKLRERSVRMGLIRSAVVWTPFFVASAGALIFFFFDQITGGERGTWFLIVVLSLFSLLFGSQSLQAIVDVFGKPKTMTGPVTRRWSRNDSLVLKTHYVRVGKTILRGDPFVLAEIAAGDNVEARYYKHSGVLVGITKLRPPAEEASPAVRSGI